MGALPAENVELVAITRSRMRNEQFPITKSAHAHRMASRIPVVEITDDADPLRIGRQHDKGHARYAFQLERMRAELVVKPLMGPLAEQVEVIVGENRRKAIGVVEIDDGLPEARAQLIGFRTVRKNAGKQAVFVDARERGGLAMRVDGVYSLRFGQEGAHDGAAVLGVRAEIVKRIGMAAFQDRAGFGGKFGHAAS